MSKNNEYPKRKLSVIAFNGQLEAVDRAILAHGKSANTNNYGNYSHQNRYAVATVAASAVVQRNFAPQSQSGSAQYGYTAPSASQSSFALPAQHSALPVQHSHSQTQSQPASGNSSQRFFYSPTGSQFSQSQPQMVQPSPSLNQASLSPFDKLSPSPTTLAGDTLSKDYNKFNSSAHSLNSPTTFNYSLDYANPQINDPLNFKLNLDTANWSDKSSIWNKDSEKSNIW